MEFKELRECLACGSSNIVKVFDMGLQPLVNNLKARPEDIDIKFPIVVNECCVCTHKQLSIAVDPKLLFSNYLYQTRVSESHKHFFLKFAASQGVGGAILDIGCNDGTLLYYFRDDWTRVGIEPSAALAVTARITNNNSTIINDFFPTKEPMTQRFDLITAFNVFAHNDNPKRFLEEAGNLLANNGRIYILTTPARLDNYYHEHISYFTPQSMCTLAKRCGLEVKSFKTTTMHGESHLFELARKRLEKTLLLHDYDNAVGYGAAATGIVILNYKNIKLDYVVDDNPLKQWKFIPGTDIEICDFTKLVEDKRNLTIVILAHHLFDEIKSRVQMFRKNKKDVFIHPYQGVL